ncbi:NAD-dependent epimerase/dehydratase family protein [Tepidiforma sp.]|uniref:NAD-dependent epimerase/dehydratase family protein n=1 Tax=Tepidiforma sp. TaxID=2682230 RepID=UPI002ADD78C0|nr:NAD-dependent epimerase/dehydratase family protein [Tepidiforma sp.]
MTSPTGGSRWLITGGTGFLGSHIARRLLDDGIHPVLFDIAPLPPDDADIAPRVTFIQGDVQDREAIRRALEGVDIVIHAAAALPIQVSRRKIYATNVRGTRYVLHESLKAGIRRLVFISSTAVYGVPKTHPIDETSPLVPLGHYGASKVVGEQLCRDYQQRGLEVNIIRPKTFLGTGRLGVFEILFEWIAEGRRIPLLGNGRNHYQLLEVTDLVDAIVRAATSPTAVNETMNVGADRFQTLNEDMQALFDHAGSGSRLWHLPARPGEWALRVLELLRLSPLAAWHYATMWRDSYVEVDRAKQLLGWQPRYSNAEALIRAWDWYIENKGRYETGVTHRVAWQKGALAILRRIS